MRHISFLAVLMTALSMSAAASTCFIQSASINFGEYNPLDRKMVETIGRVSISCESDSQTGEIPVSISLVRSAETTSGHRIKSAGDSLRYDLYIDASRTITWGDGSGGTQFLKGTVPLSNGRGSRDFNVYGRLLPGQPSAGKGQYHAQLTLSAEW